MTDTPLSTLLPLAARVVRLPFARALEAPDFPAIRTVQQHWDSLRDGRPAPGRAEVDPRQLAGCLDKVFVAELIAPGVARMRLAGQHLADLLGMEPRGMPLSVFLQGTAREELANALAQVQQGARITLPLRSDKAMGQPVLDAMLALLPLTDRDGRMTRILGVLETLGAIGRAPRRFRTLAPAQSHVPVVGRPQLRVIAGGRA